MNPVPRKHAGEQGPTDLTKPRSPAGQARSNSPAQLWQTQLAFRDQVLRLTTADQLDAARATIEDAKRRSRELRAAAGGDGHAWRSARARLRNSLQKELAKDLPKYEEIRKLQRDHLQALAATVQARPPLLDPVIAPADPIASVFRPPFNQQSLISPDGVFNTMQIADRSFARREIGHLVVDADLDADPGAVWGLNEWFGVLPIDGGVAAASCGVAFSVPEAGRLRITATLRNFYSRASQALRDEWGFSSGSLTTQLTLFLAVLRPDGGEIFHSLLAADTLESDGDDVTEQLPLIEQDSFQVAATTQGGFEAGEVVSVLAGVQALAGSTLNDMTAHVNVLLWWGLQELTVAVEPGVDPG